MDNRNCIKKTVADYAVPFALWDLRLYLDTHPDDCDALKLFSSLCDRAENTCACRNMNVPCDATHWSYIDGPWPWEPDANIAPSAVCACNGTGSAGTAGVRQPGNACGCHTPTYRTNERR